MWLTGGGVAIIMLIAYWDAMGLPQNTWLMLGAIGIVLAPFCLLQLRGGTTAPDLEPATTRDPHALPQKIENAAFFASAGVPYFIGLFVWGLDSDWPLVAGVAGTTAFVIGYIGWLRWKSA